MAALAGSQMPSSGAHCDGRLAAHRDDPALRDTSYIIGGHGGGCMQVASRSTKSDSWTAIGLPVGVGGWRLVAVGGCWWLTVGGRWRLAVGGWRLAAVGGWWSLGAVLKGCLNVFWLLKDSPGGMRRWGAVERECHRTRWSLYTGPPVCPLALTSSAMQLLGFVMGWALVAMYAVRVSDVSGNWFGIGGAVASAGVCAAGRGGTHRCQQPRKEGWGTEKRPTSVWT